MKTSPIGALSQMARKESLFHAIEHQSGTTAKTLAKNPEPPFGFGTWRKQIAPDPPGFTDEKRQILYWYEKKPEMKGDGFFAEVFTHDGQWGTHVDPPSHFQNRGGTVD